VKTPPKNFAMKETTQNFQELFGTLSDGKSQDCGNVKRLVGGGEGSYQDLYDDFEAHKIAIV